MLCLLQTPTWQPEAAPPSLLPCTVPAALVIYLALQPGWVEREKLACLFWPERATSDALHKLRITLHRVRTLLQGWGCEAALDSERQRLRLALPTDVVAQRSASDLNGLLACRPWRLLEGFRVPGFEPFQQWVDDERAQGVDRWAQAVCKAVQAAGDAASAEALAALRPLLRQHAPQVLPQLGEAGAAGATPLLGRADEQWRLRSNTLPVVLILGEAGIGKSTLVRATFTGQPMMRGREGLEAVPFGAIVDLLRAHPRWCEGLGPYRLDVARLLPELASGEHLPPLDAQTAKLRLLEGLARLVSAQTELLLVDDLQWCDSATLEWLVYLAHQRCLRWVATARDHELGAGQRQALQALRAARLVLDLPLGGLPPGELARLCQNRRPGVQWTVERVEQLWRRSGGNPFFALELLEAGYDGLPPTRGPSQLADDLVSRRLQQLGPQAQAVLEAAAVLARPAPLPLLAAVLGHDGGAGSAALVQACEQALSAGLLIEAREGLECRHDLIRSALYERLSMPRRQWLHRQAALALGSAAEPMALALHWEQAGERQTALAWRYRAARQLKDQGRLDDARSAWQQVAQQALDPALALRAELALAECALFDDLAAGRDALNAVLARVPAIADPQVRSEIEGQALAGLVDNLVFAGDQPAARQAAARLRRLLPRMPEDDRVHALEVLIELAMREPDIPGAWRLLAQAKRLAPQRPSLLSMEAQIHWFGSDVRAARAGFEQLLSRYPEYCKALTIENDLAVMCQSLGDLQTAERMARASLENWRGVLHTEALSLLVLGSTLTSAGRYGEALATLQQAEQVARAQSSQLFLSEAWNRRAQLLLAAGHAEAALALLGDCAPMMRPDENPLRLSALLATRVAAHAALGHPVDADALQGLADVAGRSEHPLVHLRRARAEAVVALQAGDWTEAQAAALRIQQVADRAGVLEGLVDAGVLQVRAAAACGTVPAPLLRQLAHHATVAEAQGFTDLVWRAHTWLAALGGEAQHGAIAEQAMAQLRTEAAPLTWSPDAAARREPMLPPARP